jgi:transposase-like protein
MPSEVVTDAAPVYPAVLDDLLSTAWHHVEQYANNPIEADPGQLKRRLRPMRGLQPIGPPKWSSPDTPSSRNCAAATTTSHSTPRRPQDSPQHSTSLLEESERAAAESSSRPPTE